VHGVSLLAPRSTGWPWQRKHAWLGSAPRVSVLQGISPAISILHPGPAFQ
jgi:hypothetical protein